MIEAYKKDAKAFLLEKEGIERKREKIFSLDKNVTFEKGKIFYKDIEFGSYDEEARIIKIDRQKALDKNGRNPLLKHPSYPPSTTILVTDGKNTHTYITDAKGRVAKSESIVKEINKNRVSDEQTKGKLFGDEDGYVDTNPKLKDQGGHRTATSAGGIPEVINTYAQAHSLNNGKENRDNERDCIKALNKDGVYKLTQTFSYDGESKRPTKIISILNNNTPKELINLNIKSQFLNTPTFSKASFNDFNFINIFKEKKVWITSLIALICLMLVYGMSLYNESNNGKPKNSKLEPNLSTKNRNSNVISKSTKADTYENLILENRNILFNKKSSVITKNDYVILQKIVDTVIKSKKNYSFSIEGFSCDLGSDSYNNNLSNLRAKNIENYLINNGLDSSKIKISWFGETKFINNGNLENSRKMARSVIIRTNE